MSTTAEHDRVKVFVSYSRADREFADQLVLGLQACGFESYIDREDIAAGEDWAARLGGLIAAADTVVYVLSPDALTSEHCAWEVEETLRLNKRLLPVVWRPVDDGSAPPQLSRLNYILFSGEGRSFATGLSELAAALRVDVDWIREHTRIGELAARWGLRNRSGELLLRGGELDAAFAWRDARSPGAPALTEIQSDFLRASMDARRKEEARRRRARAGLLTTVSIVAVGMTGLASLAGLLAVQASAAAGRAERALLAESEANEQMRAAQIETAEANRALEAASLRLRAKISLQAAPRAAGYFTLPPGWFPVAADFSGAVVRVERLTSEGGLASQASGFVIDGALLSPAHAGRPLLMTPAARSSAPGARSFNLARPDGGGGPGAPPPDTLPADAPPLAQRIVSTEPEDTTRPPRLTFPALAPEAPLTAGALLWSTPRHLGGVTPFEIWAVEGDLPFGARMMTAADVDCSELGFGPGSDPGPPSPVAMYGAPPALPGTPAPDGVRLYVSEMISRADPYQLWYTHSTALGSFGAAVFDLDSGRVLAVHIGSTPDDSTPGGRRGFGVSFRLILDGARMEMDGRDGPVPPVCGA